MKKHRVTLALTILVLMGAAFQHEAASGQPLNEASLAETVASEAGQPTWREFSSRQGGFSVLMPGTPQEQTEAKDFPTVGKGVVHLFVLAHETGVYVAGYLEVPGLARQSQVFCDGFGKGFLQSIGEATAKGAGGKMVKDTDISMGNSPGKEILIELPSGIATVRAYFIKRRGYQLLVAPPASGSDDAGDVKRFLDSFKVTAQ